MQQPEDSQVTREASIRARKLHALGIVGPVADEVLDRYALMAANFTNSPIALVNLVDDRRQMFCGLYVAPSVNQGSGSKAHEVISTCREMPLDQGYCMDVVSRASPLVLNDVSSDQHRASNPLVDRGCRAYLGVPLTDASETVLGTVCVMDFEPRGWQDKQLEGLQRLSMALTVEIGSRDRRVAGRTRFFETLDESSYPVVITRTERLHISYANPFFRSLFGDPAAGEDVFRDMGILAQLKDIHASVDTNRQDAVKMTTRSGEFIFVARRLPGQGSNEVIAVGIEAERLDEGYLHLHAHVSHAAEMLH
ncbi:GAF domain-containing protein [Streptomyces sp. NPDC058256]|uniref:GAF domain-containing protein n=1 Tax=Streptomyces sp. NPDC058256 TaxID=3346408 RepID=UPI0036DFBF2E